MLVDGWSQDTAEDQSQLWSSATPTPTLVGPGGSQQDQVVLQVQQVQQSCVLSDFFVPLTEEGAELGVRTPERRGGAFQDLQASSAQVQNLQDSVDVTLRHRK